MTGPAIVQPASSDKRKAPLYSRLQFKKTLAPFVSKGGSRGRPGGPGPPPLCLDENEARRAETTFFLGRGPPVSEGLDRQLFSGLF